MKTRKLGAADSRARLQAQAHIDDAIFRVFNSEKTDFVTLVKIAGLDPSSDFRFANLAMVDFSGSDLAGFDFTGACIDRAVFRGARIAGAVFKNIVGDASGLQHAEDWTQYAGRKLISIADTFQSVTTDASASEALSDWQQKIAHLTERLTRGVPLEPADRTPEQQAVWLLANVLNWHRREDEGVWFEYMRLRNLSDEELLEERTALAGLVFMGPAGGTARAPIHRYRFPAQHTDLCGGEVLHTVGGTRVGTLVEISAENRTVDIKKRRDTKDSHPTALFAHQIIDSRVLADALVRVGEYVAVHGIKGSGPFEAARDLLLKAAPRTGGRPVYQAGEAPLQAAIRLAPHFRGVLSIQGPPGSGKTHIAALMICALVRAGKKVGITANSHSAVRNLLDAVVGAANESGQTVSCIQKVAEKQDDSGTLRFTPSHVDLLKAIAGPCDVAGGTAWLWARADAAESVDVLFIEDGAQMSLANALAVSHAAKSIVLLGDPRQFVQPMRGSHPEGTDVSALDYILGERATIPAERGVFLAETWRLHPTICTFTSKMFYDGRLVPRPGNERQMIKSTGSLHGSGLRFLAVPHQGNQSYSPEEADAIRTLVQEILGSNATLVDREGQERSIALDDILIIAPYAAQVLELQNRLPGARIGTVDKFQGQEAAIVIYSVTTSTDGHAPSRMKFAYSANRLNFATSRAKCLCVLVAAAAFVAECRRLGPMQMTNAFCRYLEFATPI